MARGARILIAVTILVGACRNSPSSAAFTAADGIASGAVPARAPSQRPAALFDSLGTVSDPAAAGSLWIRSMVSIVFRPSTEQSARAAAIASISGTVVGGFLTGDDGEYFVRIPGATHADIVTALNTARAQPGVDFAYPMMVDPDGIAARRRTASR